MGLWRPIPARPAAAGGRGDRGPSWPHFLRSSTGRVQTAAIHAATASANQGGRRPAGGAGRRRESPDSMRAEALKALDQLNDPAASRGRLASACSCPAPGAAPRRFELLAKVDPAAAIAPLRDRLEHGSPLERQGAIAILAAMPGEAARRLLVDWLDRLIAGQASA